MDAFHRLADTNMDRRRRAPAGVLRRDPGVEDAGQASHIFTARGMTPPQRRAPSENADDFDLPKIDT